MGTPAPHAPPESGRGGGVDTPGVAPTAASSPAPADHRYKGRGSQSSVLVRPHLSREQAKQVKAGPPDGFQKSIYRPFGQPVFC